MFRNRLGDYAIRRLTKFTDRSKRRKGRIFLPVSQPICQKKGRIFLKRKEPVLSARQRPLLKVKYAVVTKYREMEWYRCRENQDEVGEVQSNMATSTRALHGTGSVTLG